MSSPEDERISEACSLEDPQVIRALCEYREALAAGHPLERHGVLSKFPQIQGELRNCLDALDMMHDMAGRIHKSGYRAPGKPVAGTLSDSENLLGDFRLIRMIGRGGMGVVYEAEQLSLQRRVALKILPASVVLDPTNLRRFKIESQAAASLDHPNIVSVYAVGCEEGVHYYAMQYIHGQTLDQIIRRLREESSREGNKEPPGRNGRTGASGKTGSPGAATPQAAGMLEPTTLAPAPGALNDPSARTSTWQTPRREPNPPPVIAISEPAAVAEIPPSAAFPRSARDPGFFRAAARLGIQAADGLQHAHEMGVVHRDIKPGNLILDGRGCLRITDFGLARTAQNADTTLSGGLAGTLRYMSPEQLSGARHVLDHRTDIYSLGITLYELLTLEPAFDSGSREELMRRIAEDEPRSPRRMNRAVPKDLETIVLKSMAKEPAGRYAAAKDLADDLRRFLEHKPILARPASLGDRLVKWSRRHLWIIWTLVGLLGIGLVAASASSLIIWRARQDKEAARAKAQANFDDAVAAVDQMLSWVGQESLRNIPEMEQVRLGILNDALNYYQRFLVRNSDDAMVQEQTGRAAMRVAELYRLLGHQDSAAASYQRAIDLLTELREDAPNGRVFPLHLGYAYAGLAAVLHSTGGLSEAAEAYQKAIDVFQGRPSEAGPEADSQIPVVETRIQLASLLADLGEIDEAERHYRSEIQRQRTRMSERPLSWAESRALARGCIGLGNLLYRTGRCPEAAESYRMAVELRRELAGGVPKEPEEMEELAWSLNNLGAALWSTGDLAEAKETLKSADEIADNLASRFPTAAAYRSQYAAIQGNLALVKKGSQRDEEAEADDRRAIEVLEALAAESPEVLAYRQQLGKFLNNLGTLLARQSRWAEAEAALQKAIDSERLLALVYDDQPENSADLARSLANLAVLFDSANRQSEAEKVWEEYAKVRSVWQARFSASALGGRLPPADISSRPAAEPIDMAVVSSCPLRWSYWSPKESSAPLGQAQDCPNRAAMSRELAWMLATRPGGARDDLVRAAEQARLAVALEPRKMENWQTLGLAEYRLGNHTVADESLKRAVIVEGRHALPMYLLALVHCRMGNFEQAHTWYGMAEELWKKDAASLDRLPGVRDEAAAILGSLHQSRATGKSPGTSPEANQ